MNFQRRAVATKKQTVSRRDSGLRAYMDVFTACLRFVTAAAFTKLAKYFLEKRSTDWH
jgi:hypothetical protein